MSKEELFKNYRPVPKPGARITTLFKHYDLNRHEVALSLLGSGCNLLDLGCGRGEFIFSDIGKRFTKIYGLDIQFSRIKLAMEVAEKNDLREKFCFIVSDIENGLPFKDASFDNVVCISTLYFMRNPYAVIKEINRTLCPGGQLVLLTINKNYLKHQLLLYLGKLRVPLPEAWALESKEIWWEGIKLHYSTLKELRSLLSKVGFEVKKITGSGLFAELRNWYPSLLTADLCIKAIKREDNWRI
ncbi:MAG: methyltransferase domain-containing protein [Proteobacteria bacterium]|nr:methyltransferase domain-containing protein [Pseudomonadota bacterium]